MANQRTTFGKRQREQNRKDKAKAKQERLEARRASPTGQKGPPIAWDEAVQVEDSPRQEVIAPEIVEEPAVQAERTQALLNGVEIKHEQALLDRS